MKAVLIDLLRQANWLTEEQCAQIEIQGDPDLKTLVTEIGLNAQQLCQFLSHQLGISVVSLSDYDYLKLCRELNQGKLWHDYQALPIERHLQHLTIAVADPTTDQLEEMLRFHCGCNIELVLCDGIELVGALQYLYGVDSHPPLFAIHEATPQAHTPSKDSLDNEPDHQHATISQYIDDLFTQAQRRQASDIHLEPFEHHYRIRLRCDGLLNVIDQPDIQLGRRIIGRIKILAKLDIAEQRLPQDGRLQMTLNQGLELDMRVSTLPTLWGEKVVLRVVDKNAADLDLTKLGLTPTQQHHYVTALNKPQGLILVTGPTGSGKTVTLYSGLKHLNRTDLNIASAEDPIEIQLDGINQVQINTGIGFHFAHALRAFLRQDPDVLMVGEIRDQETADIAVKAAQTGHLVLATLHTQSASESITRLSQIGVEMFNLASSINLIIAQRLVRKLCTHCKQPAVTESGDNNAQHPSFTADPNGCSHCYRGYQGRVGIYELMPIDRELALAIAQSQPLEHIQHLAEQKGMQTLQQSATLVYQQGNTSYAEIQRVLS